MSQGGFTWSTSLLALLFRECVGDGYPAAVPAVILAGVAAVAIARRPFRDPTLPLIAAVLASVILALAADAKFNYFFAIRQVIYMVPFLLLLAAEGATILWAKKRYRAPVAVLATLFVAAAITKDYRHLTDRKENWNQLSVRLSEAVQGGCILFPGGDGAGVYTVFRPEIAHQVCDPGLSSRRIIVPLHPYTDPRATRWAEEALSARGMTRLSSEQVGFAKIEVFTKREAYR